MAAHYKLYGLLFVFLNLLQPLSSSAIIFLEEPKTDKSCYVPGENGILTTIVSIQDLAAPLDQYIIAWNQDPDPDLDGTGTWPIYGTECPIYRLDSSKHYVQNAHCKATFVYDHNVISFKMEVNDLARFWKEKPGLYAFVIDRTKDLIVARSSRTASFRVDSVCPLPIPTNDIPLTKEADPSSTSSTHTSSSSPSPSSVGGCLSQKWSTCILTSHMEEIISRFTKSNVLVATGLLLFTLISYTYSVYEARIRDVQFFFPDVYDYSREWFRRLWRRVLQQYREHMYGE